MKKAIILTNGCPENRIDSAKIEMLLKANNWELSEKLPDADLILFNTCGITEYTQNRSIEFINDINKRKKEGAKFAVCGCLPKINNNLLREFYHGPVFASDDWDSIINFMNVKNDERDIHANYLIPFYNFPNAYRRIEHYIKNGILFSSIFKSILEVPYRKLIKSNSLFSPDTFSIKISTGCLNSCSFCAVKLSRGHLRSREINDIIEEFKIGLRKGFNKFALVGTDTGSYGKDLGLNLVILLQELIKIEGEYKIALRNVNPKYLKILLPDLVDVFNSGKISHISTPAESGSNNILEWMNRGYSIEEFKKIILFFNKEYPQIKLHTQLLVGFPGETKKDFDDTLDLVRTLNFDFIEFYIYSIRPNTAGELLKDKVPNRVATMRYYLILYRFLINRYLKRYKKF